MHIRTKFVTNSSSTSIIGWGMDGITRAQMKELDYELPDGVEYACPPSDDYILYVPMPNVGINEEGILQFPDPNVIQEEYKALRAVLDGLGITDRIYFIQEGWYDG